MTEFRFTLEKWIEKWIQDDGYDCDYDWIVVVTPGFMGDEEDPLALSIEKWEFIVGILQERPGIEIHGGGEETRALCVKHWDDCKGCPVKEATGRLACIGSPYGTWTREYNLTAAQAELEFLRQLKGEQA